VLKSGGSKATFGSDGWFVGKPMPVKVEAGKTNEYQTATLSMKSAGDQYYYVLDRNGTELGHNKLNAPLAFPEGTYSVKVANETRPVTLTAAKITVLNW
jgi:hypothetical protein